MTTLPATAIRITDDGITIDAEALAPKLGLTVETLQENMAKGLVTSVTESGVDEDSGRTRLTFRYRARTWRVVVEADGTVFEPRETDSGPAEEKGMPRLIDWARRLS